MRERSTSDVYASRPCPRRAASRATSRLASAATSPASLRRERPGRSGGVGTPSAAQLLDQALDPGRVGLGVDAVDRRHPLALAAAAATCSLVRIISRSISRCASVWATRAGADHVAVGVEAELGLEGLDLEAGRAAPLAERRGRLARDRQRLGDRLRRLRRGRRRSRRAGRSRGGRRSGCGCGRSCAARGSPPAPSSISAVTASRSTPGARLQASLAQRVRQHRLDRARGVGAVGAAPRLEVERRAGPHVGGDVGDVDPDPGAVALALGRDGVVEVARGRRVDGEGRQRGEVAARRRARARRRSAAAPALRPRARRGSRGTPSSLAQQRLDRVARAFLGARPPRRAARPRRRCAPRPAWRAQPARLTATGQRPPSAALRAPRRACVRGSSRDLDVGVDAVARPG